MPRRTLTKENIEWARNRASQKDELAKIVIDVARICESHEALREALQDLCDAIPDATVQADPPLGAWVERARVAITGDDKHPADA